MQPVVSGDLSSVLPRSELEERFGSQLVLEEYGKKQLPVIARKKPEGLHEVAATVWNRLVTRKWNDVDPKCLAKYFDDHSPTLYKAMERILQTEVVKDIYYVLGWKKNKRSDRLVVEMLVAWVYRNDLHLADVTFRNPDQPIPKGQGFAFQTHRGLGLLPILIGNMEKTAKQLNCEQLTLIAATSDQMNLFGRYGFVTENSSLTRLGLSLGVGIPMEKEVK